MPVTVSDTSEGIQRQRKDMDLVMGRQYRAEEVNERRRWWQGEKEESNRRPYTRHNVNVVHVNFGCVCTVYYKHLHKLRSETL